MGSTYCYHNWNVKENQLFQIRGTFNGLDIIEKRRKIAVHFRHCKKLSIKARNGPSVNYCIVCRIPNSCSIHRNEPKLSKFFALIANIKQELCWKSTLVHFAAQLNAIELIIKSKSVHLVWYGVVYVRPSPADVVEIDSRGDGGDNSTKKKKILKWNWERKREKKKKRKSEKGERHLGRHRHVRSVFVGADFDVFVGCFSFARLLHFLIGPNDKSVVDHTETIRSLFYFFKTFFATNPATLNNTTVQFISFCILFQYCQSIELFLLYCFKFNYQIVIL